MSEVKIFVYVVSVQPDPIVTDTFTLMCFNILQISDLHLRNNEEKSSSILDNLTLLLSSYASSIDAVVVTGDICEDMSISTKSVDKLLEQLNKLNKPVLVSYGNHDRRDFVDYFNRGLFYRKWHIHYDEWNIFSVDTGCENIESGAADTNNFRDKLHQVGCRKYCGIFTHHQPVHIGHDMLDMIGLKNSSQLISLANDYIGELRFFGFGHIHHGINTCQSGIHYFSCSSPAFELEPNTNQYRYVDTNGFPFNMINIDKDAVNVFSSIFRMSK